MPSRTRGKTSHYFLSWFHEEIVTKKALIDKGFDCSRVIQNLKLLFMTISILLYGILFILAFGDVYYLGYRTGLSRSFDHITDPELLAEISEERKWLKLTSIALIFSCIISLVIFMILFGQNKYWIINLVLIVLTPPGISLLPYHIGKRFPYSWEKKLKTPDTTGIVFD